MRYFLMFCLIFLPSYASALDFTSESEDAIFERVEKNLAVLVDTRSAQEWKKAHFKFAVSLPADELEALADEEIQERIPQSKPVYTHCQVGAGTRAMLVAKRLEALGYDVRPLKQGFLQLKDSHQIVEAK